MPTATYEPSDTTASPTDVVWGHSSLSRLPTGGDLTLIPGGWLPREQEYYWSAEWQAGEQETLRELADGGGVEFDNTEDLIHWLLSSDED